MPVRTRFPAQFHACPGLLCKGYRAIPGVKWPGRGLNQYLTPPSVSSWSVLGWTLPLPLPWGRGGGETVILVSAASDGSIVHPYDNFIYSCCGLRLSVDLRPLVGPLCLTWMVDEWICSTDGVITGRAKPSVLLSLKLPKVSMELNLVLHVEKLASAARVFAWPFVSQREINVTEQTMQRDPGLKGFLGVIVKSIL